MQEQTRTNPVARVYVTKEDGQDWPMYEDEWHAWVVEHRSPDQYADPKLKRFLSVLRDKYLAGSYVYYEEAVPEALAGLSAEEVDDTVQATNVHLKNSNCSACSIINDAAFAENNDTGEEGPLVDYDLTADNLATFLGREGREGMHEHLKLYLPLEEWQALTTEKENRFFSRSAN